MADEKNMASMNFAPSRNANSIARFNPAQTSHKIPAQGISRNAIIAFFAFLIFGLILLSASIYAQTPNPQTQGTQTQSASGYLQNAPSFPIGGVAPAPDIWGYFGLGKGTWTGWAHNIGLIALFSLACVTCLYMIAIATSHNSLKNWCKGEYVQILATFILAASLIGLTSMAWGMMFETIKHTYEKYSPTPALKGYYYDPFVFTQAYITNNFLDCQVRIYRVIYYVNYYYRFAGSLRSEIIGAEAMGGWYTSVYTSVFEYILQSIDRLMLMHYLQYRFLSIIKYTMPLLFQAGLVARVFPLTRGAGGMLMAIGFGFFAVYPISLALLTSMQPEPPLLCKSFGPPPLMDGTAFCAGDAADIYQARSAVISEKSKVDKLISEFKIFIPFFYMQSVFLPLVSLTITFTFIRQMSSLFGADLNEIGRGLVKLI